MRLIEKVGDTEFGPCGVLECGPGRFYGGPYSIVGEEPRPVGERESLYLPTVEEARWNAVALWALCRQQEEFANEEAT
jgi:hypothetical protein